MKKRFSIALATYNGENYLIEQLKSFVSQTFQPDEIVVCDDGSTDNTLRILQEFSCIAPFDVRIFVNERNLGYAQNFSKALSLCSGDYIFLSDQDDVWHPEKIERMFHLFESEPKVQLIIHDIEFCKEDLTPIGQTKIQRMKGSYDLQTSYVVGMATAVRRHFLELCLPVPLTGNITHDSWLHQCASALNGKMIINDILAFHRRHSSNKTSEMFLNSNYVINNWHITLKELSDIINKKATLNKSDTSLFQWLLQHEKVITSNNYLSENELKVVKCEEEKRIKILEERVNILSMGHLKRLPHIFKLIRCGGYKYFKGWKSVARDLFLQ